LLSHDFLLSGSHHRKYQRDGVLFNSDELKSTPNLRRIYATRSIYGQLGRNPELLPEIIPELYKLFADFGSGLVRGAAIQAITKILEKSPDALPQNMVDLLIVYLTDFSSNYVRKSAVRAVQYLEPGNRGEIIATIRSLLALDEHYKNEPYFREEILGALIHVTWNDDDLIERVTAPVIIRHCQISELYVAEDALRDFERLLPRLPDEFKVVFAREVLSFLARSERERFNNETFTGRYELLLSLFDLSREAVLNNLSGIQQAARAKAKEDPWDAFRFVQLLSYFEMYAEAAKLADEIEASQEKVKRNEWAIRQAKLLGSLTRAEALVELGQVKDAIKNLEQASNLEAEQHAEASARNPRDVISTITVANEIADDIE